MFIVRETFTAKPGMASKLAKLFQEMTGAGWDYKMRVMTDAVGPFNTVVFEIEVPQFSDFEKMMRDFEKRTDLRERMKGYMDMYLEGKREIYRLV